MRSKSCLLFIIFILVAASCQQKKRDDTFISKIKLTELNGDPIDLNQFKGKTVFINFWATWCGPCIKEMPSIERAKNTLKDSNIEFLVASNETVEQIQSFIAKRKIDLHYVQLQNLEELAISALPVTYIINPAGELVFSEAGYREWDDAANMAFLNKIVNENN